jgi:CubicO group peptidase (beta-lactamase class C family)
MEAKMGEIRYFPSAALATVAVSLSVFSGCASVPRVASGYVAPGYEAVRDEFERNLAARGETGGAFAAVVDGITVVDIWGGSRTQKRGIAAGKNSGEAWERDTMVNVFSATKGMASFVIAHLRSRGLLDYDAPVARYWPEFAAHGKDRITVRQLLSHEAGILFPPSPLDGGDVDSLARVLGDTVPEWKPGEYCGYHAGTIGYCIQVLCVRVDPSHRTVGRYLREEFMDKLGEEFYIGVPDDIPDSRIAELKAFSPIEAMLHLAEIPPGLRVVLFNPRSLFWRSMGGPGGDINDRRNLARENPAGFGVGTARALAAVYGSVAAGGGKVGLSAETLGLIFGEAERPSKSSLDRVMNLPDASYGLGFQKPDATFPFSTDRHAIGFLGASGAFAYADRTAGIGAAYVTNRMSPGTQINDPRERALRETLYACVSRARTSGGPRE